MTRLIQGGYNTNIMPDRRQPKTQCCQNRKIYQCFHWCFVRPLHMEWNEVPKSRGNGMQDSQLIYLMANVQSANAVSGCFLPRVRRFKCVFEGLLIRFDLFPSLVSCSATKKRGLIAHLWSIIIVKMFMFTLSYEPRRKKT